MQSWLSAIARDFPEIFSGKKIAASMLESSTYIIVHRDPPVWILRQANPLFETGVLPAPGPGSVLCVSSWRIVQSDTDLLLPQGIIDFFDYLTDPGIDTDTVNRSCRHSMLFTRQSYKICEVETSYTLVPEERIIGTAKNIALKEGCPGFDTCFLRACRAAVGSLFTKRRGHVPDLPAEIGCCLADPGS